MLKTNARFSQLLNWTAGISETGKFLKLDVNLESKQDLSLDLNLQYPESKRFFSFFFKSHSMGHFFISILSCSEINYYMPIL